MPVERINKLRCSVFDIGMTEDHHVSPAPPVIAREDHQAMCDAVNRIAEIGVPAACSVPILAEMAVGTETACHVIFLGTFAAHWRIEPVRHTDIGGFLRKRAAAQGEACGKKERGRAAHEQQILASPQGAIT